MQGQVYRDTGPSRVTQSQSSFLMVEPSDTLHIAHETLRCVCDLICMFNAHNQMTEMQIFGFSANFCRLAAGL